MHPVEKKKKDCQQLAEVEDQKGKIQNSEEKEDEDCRFLLLQENLIMNFSTKT